MFETPTKPEVLSARRMLLMAGPNRGKTAIVCEQWPRPLQIVSVPGEKGYDTIPRGVPGITPYIWKSDPTTKQSSYAIIQEVERTVLDICAGKKGPVQSLCIDGIHKYYDFVLDYVTGGLFFTAQASGKIVRDQDGVEREEWFDPRVYGRAHERFKYFITQVNETSVPYIVWNCSDGREPDIQGVKKSPTHVFPDLPGKMAKRVMGEFAVTIYQEMNLATALPKQRAKVTWQLIPEGDIWGAAIKAPIDVATKLPKVIEGNLKLLESTLEKAYREAYTEAFTEKPSHG